MGRIDFPVPFAEKADISKAPLSERLFTVCHFVYFIIYPSGKTTPASPAVKTGVGVHAFTGTKLFRGSVEIVVSVVYNRYNRLLAKGFSRKFCIFRA